MFGLKKFNKKHFLCLAIKASHCCYGYYLLCLVWCFLWVVLQKNSFSLVNRASDSAEKNYVFTRKGVGFINILFWLKCNLRMHKTMLRTRLKYANKINSQVTSWIVQCENLNFFFESILEEDLRLYKNRFWVYDWHWNTYEIVWKLFIHRFILF